MSKVIFVKDIERTYIDKYVDSCILDGSTLIVYHDFYDIRSKYDLCKWSVFKASYFNYSPDNFIVIGLNRMRTSGERYDLVFKYMYKLVSCKCKIVIDDSPFIGEPWRVWYHYGFIMPKWLGIDYSNPLETDWKKWFYREINNCVLDGDTLRNFVVETISELDRLTTQFSFRPISESEQEYYDEAKEHVFKQFDTPKLLVNNLLKLCNSHFGVDIGFDSYLSNKKYILPKLGVYAFVAEENMRRLKIYNSFTHVEEKI